PQRDRRQVKHLRAGGDLSRRAGQADAAARARLRLQYPGLIGDRDPLQARTQVAFLTALAPARPRPPCPLLARLRLRLGGRAVLTGGRRGGRASAAARGSRNRAPPADATRSPRLAATRSARPAAPPAPAAPQPGQTAAHTTAAPETAPPNPSMITNRTPAPTRRRSTGGLTGYPQRAPVRPGRRAIRSPPARACHLDTAASLTHAA